MCSFTSLRAHWQTLVIRRTCPCGFSIISTRIVSTTRLTHGQPYPAYNIRVVSSQSPDQFYRQPLPTVESLSSFDPNLLSGTLCTPGLSDETYRLLQYLDLASRANSDQESAIDDFAKEILRALGYEERGLLLRSRYAIPLLISGDPNRSTQTGVLPSFRARRSSTILLVVQEDKTTASVRDPEPQVIAEAIIVTFQCNNRIRVR
jgi:hypothetical protein